MRRILTLLLLVCLMATASYALDYVPGDVIVVLRNTSGFSLSAAAKSEGGLKALSSVQSFAQSSNVNVSQTFDDLSEAGGYVFMVVHSDTEDAKTLLRRISANPNVVGASLNRIYHAHADKSEGKIPDDPYYYRLWGMEAINAPYAWNFSTGSNDVYVAVVDSGVDYTHPDLKDNFERQYTASFVSPDNFGDLGGTDHGTHVAGTIAAVGNNGIGVAGVNWNLKIFSVRVLDAPNGYGTEAAILGGLNYVARLLRENPRMNLAAMNYSIGGEYEISPEEITELPTAEYLAFKAISDTNRTVICISAGNEDVEVGAPNYTNMEKVDQGNYVYPASFRGIDNAIVVAAADRDLTRAGFSNYSSKYVDVAAPGVGILSTVATYLSPDMKYDYVKRSFHYEEFEGTSMAAPHVTGVAALLKAIYPDATASQIKAAIVGGANSSVLRSGDVSMYGMLNVKGAIEFMSGIKTSGTSPKISHVEMPGSVIGQPYNFVFYASGSEPITWALDGNLPTGLSFDKGKITGVPESDDGEPFLVTATNEYGYDSFMCNLTTYLAAPPVIASEDTYASFDAEIGKNATEYVRIYQGSWPYKWEIVNKAELVSDGTAVSIDERGMLGITPAAAKTYTVRVRVSNVAGEDRIDFNIKAKPTNAPIVNYKDLKNAIVGRPYGAAIDDDFTLSDEVYYYNPNPDDINDGDEITVSCDSKFTWRIDGLPASMDAKAKGNKIRITGIAWSADVYTIRVTASNDAGISSRDFVLTVGTRQASFLSSDYDMFYSMSKDFSLYIPVMGVGPLSIDCSGDLPPGVEFSRTNYTAIFSGIPTKKGEYKLTLTAENAYRKAIAFVTLTITDPAIITTNMLPPAIVGEPYAFKFSSLGDVSLSWAESGDVLSECGLRLTASGDIIGTPTKAGGLVFIVSANALNDSGFYSTRNFQLTVNAKAEITTSSTLPSGKVGQYYQAEISANKAAYPVNWSLSGGTMPDGLGITSNGYVYGTPTKAGNYDFTLSASNAVNNASRAFTLSIVASEDKSDSGGSGGAESQDKGGSGGAGGSGGSGGQGGDDTPGGETKPTTPTMTAGGSRGISSLTAGQLATVIQEGGVVAAVLPEITVNVSGAYSYESFDVFKNVKLSNDIPAGYTLVWHSFKNEAGATEFDTADADLATFYNANGKEITTVPEDHNVNISAWLEAGTHDPVISAVAPSASSNIIGSSGGGCVAGASLLAMFMPLCALIFRKHSK